MKVTLKLMDSSKVANKLAMAKYFRDFLNTDLATAKISLDILLESNSVDINIQVPKENLPIVAYNLSQYGILLNWNVTVNNNGKFIKVTGKCGYCVIPIDKIEIIFQTELKEDVKEEDLDEFGKQVKTIIETGNSRVYTKESIEEIMEMIENA